LLTGVCFLELKESAGSVRSKIRLGASPRLLERIVDGSSDADIANALDDHARAALATLRAEIAARRPVRCLTTWYRRSCLSGENGRVRITLDQGLSFCEPHRLGESGENATPNEILARGPARILEIKLQGEPPPWLARATAGLTPAPAFSKFQMGMVAL